MNNCQGAICREKWTNIRRTCGNKALNTNQKGDNPVTTKPQDMISRFFVRQGFVDQVAQLGCVPNEKKCKKDISLSCCI